MEPNEGPNWTQTAPWNSQHGIWMNLNKSSQSDLQHWRVIWSLTLNPSGFEGAVLANTMFVTFGRPYFSLRIVLTFKKNYSGSRSVGGKSWNQNTSKKSAVTYFSICVGFRVRRTTFQSKLQPAENLTSMVPSSTGESHNGVTTGVTQREGHTEKMRNVTFMVGKWEAATCRPCLKIEN